MKQCAACGAHGTRRFSCETMRLEHDGYSARVRDLAGWRCGACGEVIFDPESATRYAAAGDALVLRARTRTQREIRRIRLKLGLSQARAAALTGGGPNAFSRYELGRATPMPAVVNLLRLLDRHPELLRELDRRSRVAISGMTTPPGVRSAMGIGSAWNRLRKRAKGE